MSAEKSQQKFNTLVDRVGQLRTRADGLSPREQQIMEEPLHELGNAVEELQVAEEELLQQNDQLRTAQELIEQERHRYQDLFDFAPDGYIVTDTNGTIREANLAAARLLNVRRDALIGKPLPLYIGQDDYRRFRTRLVKLQDAGWQEHLEVQVRPRGSPAFPAEITANPVSDRDGKIAGVRWLLRDITERKQAEQRLHELNAELERRVRERTAELENANEELRAEIKHRRSAEEALRASEERFRATYEQAGVGIADVDLDGRYRDANPQFCEFTGYTLDELRRRSMQDLTYPADLPRDQASLQRLITGEASHYSWERRYLRKDGAVVWGSVTRSLLRDGAGRPQSVITVVEDITRRKMAEAELRRLSQQIEDQARMLDGILRASPVYFYVMDRAGRFSYVSPSGSKIAGIPAADFIGRTPRQVGMPEQAAVQFEAELRQVFESGRTVEGAMSVEAPGASDDLHHFEYVLSPVFASNGHVTSVVSTTQDVTERRLAEQERARLLEREQAARAGSEASERRLAFLAEANAVLTASLNYEETLNNLAHLLTPVLGGMCVIDVIEDGQIRRLAAVHAKPEMQAVLDELRERFPPSWENKTGVARVLRSGEPVFIPHDTSDNWRDWSHSPEAMEQAMRLRTESVICVPLIANSHILGAISLAQAKGGRPFNEDDFRLVLELAWRTAVAVDNARLYGEAQKALRALTEQRNLLETILNQAADAILVCDTQGRLLFHSAAAERLARAPLGPDSLGPVVWGQAFLADGQPLLQEHWALETALRGEATVGRQVHVARNDGSEYDILISAAPLRDQQGAIMGAVASIMDVTERKQAEEALQSALERTRELYQISRLIGLVRTPDDVLRALALSTYLEQVNRAAVLLFDSPWQDGPPASARVLTSWKSEERLPDLVQREMRMAEQGLTELFLRDQPVYVRDVAQDARLSENTRAWLLSQQCDGVIMFPLVAAGQWYGMLGLFIGSGRVLSDEDARHVRGLVDQAAVAIYNMRLLETEAAARREAEKANEMKLKFLAMISHELRTPLTSIKGFATTLLADDVQWDATEERDFIQTINLEADKLTELIEQLLDLSRLDAGLLPIRPATHRLDDIVTTAMAQLQSISQHHSLVVDMAADLPRVNADRQRVGQVITNLVDNAAKYSPYGSEIRLSARRVDRAVQVDVSDQGIGIAPEERQRVFEAFRRGEGESTKRTKGAGLGLAICKGLIEAQGGRIWVQPRERPGSTVSFTLPVLENDVETVGSTTLMEPATQHEV
jgi:PAS domain S-box-containing protein